MLAFTIAIITVVYRRRAFWLPGKLSEPTKKGFTILSSNTGVSGVPMGPVTVLAGSCPHSIIINA